MSAEMDVDMLYSTNIMVESSKKEEDRKQILGLLFLYGIGVALVIILGLL